VILFLGIGKLKKKNQLEEELKSVFILILRMEEASIKDSSILQVSPCFINGFQVCLSEGRNILRILVTN